MPEVRQYSATSAGEHVLFPDVAQVLIAASSGRSGGASIMAKPKPPPPPQPRAGDVVVLRQSQEYVEGEIITVLGDGRYRVRWATGVDYRDRITTVTVNEIRKKT